MPTQGYMARLCFKQTKKQKAVAMAEVVECPPSKHKALSSTPSSAELFLLTYLVIWSSAIIIHPPPLCKWGT
jgi:hypothetical protein